MSLMRSVIGGLVVYESRFSIGVPGLASPGSPGTLEKPSPWTRLFKQIHRETPVQYAPLTISIQSSIYSPIEGEFATRAAPRIDVGASNSAMVEMPINMLH